MLHRQDRRAAKCRCFDWIEMAQSLDADGLEMYEGFFTSLEPGYLDQVGEAIHAAGFAMPMLCCSPDFTNPDADARKRAIEREVQMVGVTRRLGGPGAVCRVLSGQRYPRSEPRTGAGLGRRVHRAGAAGRPRTATSSSGWRTITRTASGSIPSSPRKRTCSSNCVNAIPDRKHFGVQYDPSNAIVAGDDPIELLRRSPIASSACTPATATWPRGRRSTTCARADGTLGYSPNLRHGVTGKGLNDYDAIFRILAEHAIAAGSASRTA